MPPILYTTVRRGHIFEYAISLDYTPPQNVFANRGGSGIEEVVRPIRSAEARSADLSARKFFFACIFSDEEALS